MLRILHVIATLDPAGAEGQLARLCLGLDRSAFEPAVCCLTRGGPYQEMLEAAGVPVTVLGKRGRFDVRVYGRLKRVMRDAAPDIVQTWLFTSNTWGRPAARAAKVPVVIASERAADIWKGPLRRWVDRRLATWTDAIVTNAEAVRAFCIDRIGLPADRIAVIRNGLALTDFDARAAEPAHDLPSRAGDLLVGTVARLEEQKGLRFLLDAAELLADEGLSFDLWIVGDGPLREPLQARVATTPALSEHVRFVGRRDDVPALMTRFDMFVLPSLWEGLPNVAIEAMAARCPVVATAVDGTPEVVLDGETGLLCAPASPEELRDAVRRLAADAPLRGRFGQAGRQRVEAHFTVERMVSETEALYRRLAAEAGIG